jgi:DNA-binding transcriptional LysR family regulator
MKSLEIEILKSRATLRQIEIIWNVYETRSISKTAENLNMSSANVSQMCSRFEEHFDFCIFSKRRKGIIFTEEGVEVIAMIAPLAREICKISETFEAPPSQT